MTTDLRSQLVLMAAQSQLFEIGATSQETMKIMMDDEAVILGMLNMGDPHQWAMLNLAKLRDAQSAEQQKE